MNFVPHLCIWAGLVGILVGFIWGLLMLVDVVLRAKLPKPRSFLSVAAVFAVSLVVLGGAVLMGEEAKRQAGAHPAPDGVMFFVFLTAGGCLLLLGVGVTAGVLLFRKLRA